MCTHFTYDDHVIDMLLNFRIPLLDTLVRSEAWNKPTGSTQLAVVWSGTTGRAAPLKPCVLISIRSATTNISSRRCPCCRNWRCSTSAGASRRTGEEVLHLAPGEEGQELTDRLPPCSGPCMKRLPITQDLQYSLPPLALRGRTRRNPATSP